jgi:hypothetical protein
VCFSFYNIVMFDSGPRTMQNRSFMLATNYSTQPPLTSTSNVIRGEMQPEKMNGTGIASPPILLPCSFSFSCSFCRDKPKHVSAH